jgi:hypothetical protein
MQRNVACRFFKWHDKPTCKRGMAVLPVLLEKVIEPEDEKELHCKG